MYYSYLHELHLVRVELRHRVGRRRRHLGQWCSLLLIAASTIASFQPFWWSLAPPNPPGVPSEPINSKHWISFKYCHQAQSTDLFFDLPLELHALPPLGLDLVPRDDERGQARCYDDPPEKARIDW